MQRIEASCQVLREEAAMANNYFIIQVGFPPFQIQNILPALILSQKTLQSRAAEFINAIDCCQRDMIERIQQRSSALRATMNSTLVSDEERTILKKHSQQMDYLFYGSRAISGALIILTLRFTKQRSFLTRELPLIAGLCGLNFVGDLKTSENYWKQHEDIIVKYTGFKDDMFLDPTSFRQMQEQKKSRKGIMPRAAIETAEPLDNLDLDFQDSSPQQKSNPK